LLRACSTASFAALNIDWAKLSFHRAGHHASLMHLAAHRKNSALAFNRLVDLTECYARCRVSETDAAVAALAKSDQSLSLEELEDLPHHDRVGLEAFRDCLLVAVAGPNKRSSADQKLPQFPPYQSGASRRLRRLRRGQ